MSLPTLPRLLQTGPIFAMEHAIMEGMKTKPKTRRASRNRPAAGKARGPKRPAAKQRKSPRPAPVPQPGPDVPYSIPPDPVAAVPARPAPRAKGTPGCLGTVPIFAGTTRSVVTKMGPSPLALPPRMKGDGEEEGIGKSPKR